VVSEGDLKIDIYRTSGGGTGSWAVRLTHVPSGTMVSSEGTFENGADPEPAVGEAQARPRTEIEARLRTLSCASVRQCHPTGRETRAID
jgi:protein subunit release factor B